MRESAFRGLCTTGVALGFLLAPLHVEGQHPVEGTEWTLHNLRDTGQPVIPIYEGWWENPDGTFGLCFGYHNLNLKEPLEIPLGPDNYLEPSQYDGVQPTHFMPVPSETKYRRQWCAFSVTVPADFGDRSVVWTLRNRGQTFSVPGHVSSVSYILDEPDADARGAFAPLVTFEQPAGPAGRGRSGALRMGPMSVAAGQPLALGIRVERPADLPQLSGIAAADDEFEEDVGVVEEDEGARWWVGWSKYHGPGDVTFSPQEIRLQDGAARAATTATFSEPGSYLLRVVAIETPSDFEYHCCWTNGYVEVTVTR